MKDPRFNFYPDNWIGGTEGFTLEQEGAYLALIIMQSKVGRFTKHQAVDKLMQKTRGNTAVCTALWEFVAPKFSTDGTHYWSERLEKEITKSKKHSQKQTERINKRWGKQNGNTAVLPVNETGNGIENVNDKEKGVQGEKQIPTVPREIHPGPVPAPRSDRTHQPDTQTLTDLEQWTRDVITGADFHFQNMARNAGLHLNGNLERIANDHLGKCARYDWHSKIKTQQAFRHSLIQFAREILEDDPAKGKPVDISSITLNDLNK